MSSTGLPLFTSAQKAKVDAMPAAPTVAAAATADTLVKRGSNGEITFTVLQGTSEDTSSVHFLLNNSVGNNALILRNFNANGFSAIECQDATLWAARAFACGRHPGSYGGSG